MANVMSMKEINGSVSRSSFDLSRKNIYSAKVSEKLPVAVVHCLPKDKLRIKTKHFTRTVQVNTAAYTRIQEHYNWYFVPYQQIWNKFNTFYTQQKDNLPVADSIDSASVLSDQHPYFTVQQLWSYVYNQGFNGFGSQNYFGYKRAELTCKLLHYLGYGDYYGALDETLTSDILPSSMVNAALSPWALLAYQKIFYDHGRNTQWEKNYAPAFNLNYMSGQNGENNIPISDLTSSLDRADKSNMFDLHYTNWNKDMFMGVLPNSQFGDVASIQIPVDIDSNIPIGGTTDNFKLYAAAYNPNANFATLGLTQNSTDGQYVKLSTDAGANLNFKLDYEAVETLRRAMGLSDFSGSTVHSAFSVLQIRLAESVQRLREIQQSHDQDFKSQMEARWHVSLSDAQSELCKWLGGSTSNIDISEVVNTNLDSESSQANIKGKGVGIGDDYVEFSTDVPGVLMCIYHASPVLDYSINGINAHNLKTYWTDYAQPELDRTGMVSVPLIQLTNSKATPADFKNKLLGYAPRYYEYKTAIDEIHGSFYNGGDENWVAPFADNYIQQYMLALSDRQSFMRYWFFKINPAILDPIFAISVDSSVETDQLKINAFFQIYAVRNLDYDGLPY